MSKLRGALLAAVFAASALSASDALAGVVLTDHFDGEHGGTSALNYTGFAQWTVKAGQRVDLVHNGDYGTFGSGSYVDLDGTPGPGQIFSKAVFAFHAGDQITIDFRLSGSQRSSAVDVFYAGLFDLNPAGNGRINASVSLDGVAFHPADVFGTQSLGAAFGLPGTSGWHIGEITFNVVNAGVGVFYFGSTSADNVGPLLDDVKLSIDAVPEPATWALMLAGFGLAGAGLRRRRAAA